VVARIGMVGVVAVFAAGIWLIAAPFVLGYQHQGAVVTGTTRTDMITGGVLAVAGFVGLFAVVAGRVGELYADARSAASLAATADRGNPGS
jgi:SPW repeat